MIKKLLSVSSLYYLSNMLQSAMKIILLPIYVRYLTVEQYGILGFVNTFTAFFSVFVFLGFDKSVSREYFDYYLDTKEMKKYLFNVLAFLLTLDLILIITAFLVGPKIYYSFLEAKKIPYYPYIPLSLFIAVVTSFYGIAMVLLQVQQKALKYVILQISKILLLTCISLVLVIKFRLGAQGVLLGDLIATIVIDITIFSLLLTTFYTSGKNNLLYFLKALAIKLKRFVLTFGNIPKIYDAQLLKRTLAFGIPFVILDLGGWLLAGTGRLFLVKFRTITEVGIYTFADSIAFGLNMLMGAFYAAYYPSFFKVASEGKNTNQIFSAMADLYAFVIGGACLAGMIFSKEIVGILAPAAYKSSAPALQILLVSMYLLGLYLIITLPLLYLKKTKILPGFLMIAALINVGANYALTPTLGIIGSAWAKTLTQGCMLVIAYLITSRKYYIKYGLLSFWGVIISMISCGFLCGGFPLLDRIAIYAGMIAISGYINFKRWHLLSKEFYSAE